MSIQIPFNKKPDFEVGQVDRLSPMIRRVIANNPGSLTFTGTGTYIVGTGQVAVIDPGPADRAHIDSILNAVADESISHILVTHTHLDHSAGCRLLQQQCQAPTFGFGPHGLGAPPRDDDFGADYDFQPDVTVAHGQNIVGENWDLLSLHTPGHAANHLSFYLAAERSLFCGDVVMGWSTTLISPPDGSMKDYMETLELLQQRDDEIYYPTHGAPITGPQAFVAALYQHRLEREQQALECIANGLNTIDVMVPVIYADLDPAMYAAAARSLYATVECLALRGQLKADELSINSVYSIP